MASDEAARDGFRREIPAAFNFGGEVVDAWARERPDDLALVWSDLAGNERRVTFAEMRTATNRMTNALAAAGIAKGDRVIVMLPRLPEWQIAMVGRLKVGAVPIPCIDMLTARHIACRLENSEARGAITTAGNVQMFAGASHLGAHSRSVRRRAAGRSWAPCWRESPTISRR